MNYDHEALEVLQTYGRSFYFASHLLSKVHRHKAARLYAVCRQIDDIADETQDAEYAKTLLHELTQAIEHHKPTKGLSNQAIRLCQDLEIKAPLLDLISGVSSDLDFVRVQNQEELLHYAYQVAGTVGLMMCEVLDVKQPKAKPFAIDLGIAMQLTNIARDLAEDARNNRVYLPANWTESITPKQILKPSPEQQMRLKKATKQLLDLAEVYYHSGLQGLPYLPGRARYGILVASRIYREIGEVIRKGNYETWRFRAKVSFFSKIGCTIRTIIGYIITKQPIYPSCDKST